MKKVRLNDLENNKNNLLKHYKLDKDSIDEFRSKIKTANSEEETIALTLKIYDLIANNYDYNDNNYLEIVELIYQGANINQLVVGENLLNICLRNNYIQTAIVLLKAGIDVNMKNNKGITPLMMCAKIGNKEILELILLMAADVNLKNEFGETALSIALKNNHKECADILINAQAYFNSNDIDRYNLSILKDKSVSPIIENSTPDLIKEAEDLLNNIDNNYNNCNLTNEIKFDLLTEDQILGDNRLELFDKYGTKCAITDFAILLGGYADGEYYNRTGWWLTKTIHDSVARSVGFDGKSCWFFVDEYCGGVRPVFSYSSIQLISSNGVKNTYGIMEIEYGEYPQTIVDEKYSLELERAYNNRSLRTTGKNYTTTEYEYNGGKYIRFIANSNCFGSVLSDGRKIQRGKIYWIKVEPISWLIDEKTGIALSKKILVSGIQFISNNHYDGIFENTIIYKYLNEIFVKDIIPSKINKLEDDDEKEKILENRKESGIKKSIKKLVKKFLDS